MDVQARMMMPELTVDETDYAKFADMFNNFFESGYMVGTYKAVFLRALTDLGKYGNADLTGNQWIHHKDDKIMLDLDFIATRFAKYYWDMEIAFKLRNIPENMADINNPKDDLTIIKLIQEESTKIAAMNTDTIMDDGVRSLNPPTIKKLSSGKMRKFRKMVIAKSIKPTVLKNLLRDMPELYEIVPHTNYILLDSHIVGFMQKFSNILNKALNYILTVHFEKNNPTARHIALKIDCEMEFNYRLQQVKKLETQIDYDSEQRLNHTNRQTILRKNNDI